MLLLELLLDDTDTDTDTDDVDVDVDVDDTDDVGDDDLIILSMQVLFWNELTIMMAQCQQQPQQC
jgi:hypothetical protein